MEDLTGKQLGPYQVIAPLGEGGMAAVYKAYHAAMDRYVALKVLPQQLAKSDPQFIGRFTQEARVLAKLQHPHILPVFDFGEAQGYTYLVMPLVETGTLKDLLRGKPLPLKQIRRIVSQVGDALDYAHTRGLVHRDVKPSNVLVDERGNCLLADFGIAKMVEGTAHFTSTGGMLGTPVYMSPEQGRSVKVDVRSDIYTLGVMLYEMATGRVPFDAETPIAVVLMHISDPLPLPRQLNPDLPEAVERVILKSLAKDPDDRYQTAGAMVEALQHAIDEFEHAKPTIAAEAFATTPETAATPEMLEKEVKPYAKPTLMPGPRRRALPTAALLALVVGIMVVGGIALAAYFARPPAGLPASSTATQHTEAVVPTEVTPTPEARSVVNSPTAPPLPTRTPTARPTPTSRPPTRTPSIPTPRPTTPAPQTTELTNWAVSFEYRFPTGFWTPGNHEYTLTSSCLNDADSSGSVTRTFEVSESAPVVSGDVFLRLGGLRDAGATAGTAITTIHPSQSTVAILSYVDTTRSEAERLARDCTATVSWDGSGPQPLVPGALYQR